MWLLAVSALGWFGCSPPLSPIDPYGRTVDDYPAWSPAESLIAFTHHAQTFEELQVRGDRQILLLNLRTGDTTYVSPGALPTWSPNGDTLGFVRSGQLYAHVLSTGATFRISTVGPCYFPAWSPSGGRIAFDTPYHDARGASVIWAMLSDGSALTDISRHGVGEWRSPAWTPDGDSLMHYRYLTGVARSELFIMARDGSGGRRLTFNGVSDLDPACSPDGRRVAFTRSTSGSHGVYVLDRITGGVQRLFIGAGRASWNPTGDSLVFSCSARNRTTLWIGDARGVRKRQLTY